MIYDVYLYKNLLSAYIIDHGLDFTLTETGWDKAKILEEFLVSFYNATENLLMFIIRSLVHFYNKHILLAKNFHNIDTMIF